MVVAVVGIKVVVIRRVLVAVVGVIVHRLVVALLGIVGVIHGLLVVLIVGVVSVIGCVLVIVVVRVAGIRIVAVRVVAGVLSGLAGRVSAETAQGKVGAQLHHPARCRADDQVAEEVGFQPGAAGEHDVRIGDSDGHPAASAWNTCGSAPGRQHHEERRSAPPRPGRRCRRRSWSWRLPA